MREIYDRKRENERESEWEVEGREAGRKEKEDEGGGNRKERLNNVLFLELSSLLFDFFLFINYLLLFL